ncbi:hypothetical protein [Actinoallomurus iriomotensis]|uniref:Uncharacterized protein n=1 Tax=Actinoallomurus iriomotensis TaxID=478107 RepID=A0A9W6VKV5_9ACTN|nr:hypothetical protein [Actinoallomurus iriomotensis]GLY75713.1 hypothetical protein Airi01_039800 [Actinoallomurus iriomotensis]
MKLKVTVAAPAGAIALTAAACGAASGSSGSDGGDTPRFAAVPTEQWLDTGRVWWARTDRPASLRTSGRTALDGAAVSPLRPAPPRRTGTVRGMAGDRPASGAGPDPVGEPSGGRPGRRGAADTHDLAAVLVLAEVGGGAVRDVFGRPLDLDLTRRWSGVVAATPEPADALRVAHAGDPVGR